MEGHRYYVILHKGLEHPWIWVSPGSWNQSPEEAEGQLHSVTLTTHLLAHLQSPVWTFYLEYIVLGGHTASLEGEDGASPRPIQHLHLNFTKTCREDSASNWPLCCHWQTLSGQLHYFLEL